MLSLTNKGQAGAEAANVRGQERRDSNTGRRLRRSLTLSAVAVAAAAL